MSRSGKCGIGAILSLMAVIWVSAFINNLLPEKWIFEWYGFPLMVTEILACVGAFAGWMFYDLSATRRR